MKKKLEYLRKKMREEKGEVSVEWALVAVIMTLIILGVFSTPGIGGAMTSAMDAISAALTSSAA